MTTTAGANKMRNAQNCVVYTHISSCSSSHICIYILKTHLFIWIH